MKTQLDKLLESIDPAITLEKSAARVDEAINSFKIESVRIREWEDFKNILTAFHWHVQKTLLRNKLSRTPDPDIEWGRCCEVLLKQYGFNGEKAAMEIARTGKEGGLYSILKNIANQLVNDCAKGEISAKIRQYWHSLSTNEQLSATEEYLKKCGHLLPSELTEGNAARIKAEFLKVLEQHPRLVMRLRELGRE